MTRLARRPEGPKTMSEPKFDIFSGDLDKDAMWIETVQGLSNARERMEEIASQKPGRYFIFSSSSHAVLSQTETFANPREISKSKGHVA